MKALLTMRQYAIANNIDYTWLWDRVKRGDFLVKKGPRRTILVVKERKRTVPGRIRRVSNEDILKTVYDLCKGRYVMAKEFPCILRKQCKQRFGSIRAAKWEAKIIHSRTWTYAKFMKCVHQFCLRKYRKDEDWPENMRYMAKHFCGSIRRAKWEAGVIHDRRQRQKRGMKITKKEFLDQVRAICSKRDLKAKYWSGSLKLLANRYCHTVRGAKWAAGVLVEERKSRRR